MPVFSGKKVAIIGPSNSGKSTLAASIGRVYGFPVLHLDQIAHRPGTCWERRPDMDFIKDHDNFLHANTQWVIEGNYSICMKQRFQAADTLVWCDPPLAGCVWRYLRRSMRGDADRAGRLEGARSEFSLKLVKYTLYNYPQKKKQYADMIAAFPHLHVMHLHHFSDVKNLGASF